MAVFLNYHFTPHSVSLNRIKTRRNHERIVCGMRDKGLSKKPLWRTAQDMSSEAINASRALRLAYSDPENSDRKIASVFDSKISRLLKSDLLSLLYHLQTSDNCALALQVFEYARKETWYKPEITLFYDMIYMFGRNKLVEEAEYCFLKLEEEGLKPDTRIFTEMIGAYMEVGMIEKAIEMYGKMKGCGCKPNELTFTLVLRNLVRFGMDDLVGIVKRDVEEYIEGWEVFLNNVEGKKSMKGMRM
ncbi:uncharacterized protein LOC143848483 [Tasmannia lanceolata]|uniref:uncharacterized protein LOC143848483 n=1 Tax=Tasmannia lanceolata TaxID=3420 RepID=UPI004064A2F8